MKTVKTYHVEVKEHRKDGGRIVISTGSVDRDRDRVIPTGGRVGNYLNNPVVQYGHNYRDPWSTVGRTVKLEVTPEGIVADFELRMPADESDTNQKIVRQLWEERWINTASIGFNPDFEAMTVNEFGGFDFNSWELLEWSLVPVPANQDALRLMAKFLNEESIVSNAIPYQRQNLMEKAAAFELPDLSTVESEALMKVAAWFDSSNPQNAAAYKLIHHSLDDYSVNFEAVKRSAYELATLELEEADRLQVQDHLGKHYIEFNSTPPWVAFDEKWQTLLEEKGLNDELVQELFGQLYTIEPQLVEEEKAFSFNLQDDDFLKLFADELVDPKNISEGCVRISDELAKEISERLAEIHDKSGRVLSKRNEERIRSAHDSLGEVLSQLETDDDEKTAVPPQIVINGDVHFTSPTKEAASGLPDDIDPEAQTQESNDEITEEEEKQFAKLFENISVGMSELNTHLQRTEE